ncbi:MAG: signal peptidase II [Gemmatimonadota bacterium]
MSHDDRGLSSDPQISARGVHRGALLAGVIGVIVVADYLSKEWIVANIPMYSRHEVIGEFLRLTYTHNPGAAFGMNIGEHSRLFFLVLALLALVALVLIYRATPRQDVVRLFAVALIASGAIGNILDRLRYEAGVVDFIDVGIEGWRFWTFNVADSAVSVGAVLLLISFWREERRAREQGNEPAEI